MCDYVQETRHKAVMPGMFYAKLMIFSGLVLLVIGLIKRPEKSNQPQRWRLLRETPADLKETIYHPKEWRKPRK